MSSGRASSRHTRVSSPPSREQNKVCHPTNQRNTFAHSGSVRLLQPHIQDILELVKAALHDENHGDPVYGLSYGIVGDLAEIFGSQIKPLLLQDWVAAELKSRRCPPENKQTMRWAREVGLFETVRVSLADSCFCLDGQTRHSVSVVLCFFLPSNPRPFTSSLQYLLYWFNLRIREILSTLGSLYLFLRALFVDGHLPGGALFYPLFAFRLHHLLYIQCSFSPSFWFESLLSIITVSFESQSSPPPLHCYITQSFSLCPAVTMSGNFARHQFTTHSLTASYLAYWQWHAHPILERISALG